MTREEESSLIQKVINGDKNAFEDLVLANQKHVYNLALKMTKNREDALDISQEVFLKAYRQLDTFRFDARFSVWLYKLTYNLCIDFLRKHAENKAKTLPLEYESDEGEVILHEVPDLRNLPEDSLIRAETRKTIADSIQKLPPKLREVLIMREITGMSYEEISATLGTNSGTVKSRLSRARLRLAEILVTSGTFPENYRLNL